MPKIPISYVEVNVVEGEVYNTLNIWVHRGPPTTGISHHYSNTIDKAAHLARRGFALIAMLAARMGVDVWRDK